MRPSSAVSAGRGGRTRSRWTRAGAAPRFAADGGLAAADPQGDLADPEPLAVPQLVDPDAFLCRQVGISFHIERDTFSLVMNLNTSNHRAGVALLFRTQGVGTCRHTDISSLLLAWVWLENGNAEAMALTDTLLRVPISAVVGVLVGALVAVLSTRESHLLKYFKNR